MRTIKKIFNTTVSVKEGASRSVLRGIIQNDTLNEVNIRLSDGSKAFDYYGYTNIIFKVLKADGTSYIDSEGENVIATSPEDGIVTVILKGQATAAAGLCQSVIEIYADGEKMTTARFNYEVFEELDVDEDAVASEDDYPVLQNLMLTMENGYVTRAEKAATKSEMSAAEAAEWARQAKAISGGNFAPDGYGLGGAVKVDFNNAVKPGFYYGTSNAPGSVWHCMVVIGQTNSNITQIASSEVTGKGFYPGEISVRHGAYSLDSGAWSFTEWDILNPPMELDIEYRTTERYLGKPVYVKLVSFGALPNQVKKAVLHGIANIDMVCGLTATAKVGAETLTVNGMRNVGGCYATAETIVIETSENLSAWTNCYCLMKYTKTTDT